MKKRYVLAVDLGGTNCRMQAQLIEESKPLKLTVVHDAAVKCSKFNSLEECIQSFLQPLEISVEAAGFGLAGIVDGDICQITKLPWLVKRQNLATMLGVEPNQVEMENDLVMISYGILALPEQDFISVNLGNPNLTGNGVVLAAGTGLGQAVLNWDGNQFCPVATQGGHATFAPENDLDWELKKHLSAVTGRTAVSWEDVLSGEGVHQIYRFLRSRSYITEPAWLTERLEVPEPGGVISKVAHEGSDKVCIDTIKYFVRLYGTQAGNLALVATGGMYIAGGVGAKNREFFTTGEFMDSFINKNDCVDLLQQVQVKLLTNESAGLVGAGYRAALKAVGSESFQLR